MARVAARPLLCRHVMTLLILILLPALNAVAQDCGDVVSQAPPAGNLKYVAKIEPSTTWQPPLGEVKFTVEGNGFRPDNIVACFRWTRKEAAVAQEKQKAKDADAAFDKEKKDADDKVATLSAKKQAIEKTTDAAALKAVTEELDAAMMQSAAAVTKKMAALDQRNEAESKRWVRSSSLRVIASDSSKTTFAVRVPSDIPYRERLTQKFTHSGEGEHYGSWSTVPVADLRIMSLGPSGEKTDYILQVGVTSVGSSLILAAVFVLFSWVLLRYFSKMWSLPGSSLILKIISTQAGYASVSQFQIVLWTFVVGAGAIYVMALSGNLIDISTGTLVLLGITGIATLGSKLKGGQDSQAAAADSAPLPTAPGSVDGMITKASQSEVKLSWRAPAAGSPPTAYTVQYRVVANPANNWKTVTSSLTRPRFTVIELTPGTPYEFQISAFNAGGSGPVLMVSETTVAADAIPAGAPGPIPNLGLAGSPTASTLDLIWGKPSGAPTSYLIEYRIHESDEFWQSAGSTANAAFTVSRLLPYTTYNFRVTPINAAGSGPPSSIFSATTGPRTPLWSDLVIPNDRKREIDVTRVQMLFFTLITAIFVAVKILVSSEIPDIPQGFLLLMGISNGVYLTAKFIPD